MGDPQGTSGPRGHWVIPAPLHAGLYTVKEIAGICGVSIRTVQGWVSPGRAVKGQLVRLKTLRVPRYKITPADLVAFLSAMNDEEVTVGKVENAGSATTT